MLWHASSSTGWVEHLSFGVVSNQNKSVLREGRRGRGAYGLLHQGHPEWRKESRHGDQAQSQVARILSFVCRPLPADRSHLIIVLRIKRCSRVNGRQIKVQGGWRRSRRPTELSTTTLFATNLEGAQSSRVESSRECLGPSGCGAIVSVARNIEVALLYCTLIQEFRFSIHPSFPVERWFNCL